VDTFPLLTGHVHKEFLSRFGLAIWFGRKNGDEEVFSVSFARQCSEKRPIDAKQLFFDK
jgi:hypothetical protein